MLGVPQLAGAFIRHPSYLRIYHDLWDMREASATTSVLTSDLCEPAASQPSHGGSAEVPWFIYRRLPGSVDKGCYGESRNELHAVDHLSTGR